MIPRIIHQTWANYDLPERFKESQRSWIQYHPDWTYMFWTDADLDRFVQKHYPSIWPVWCSYPDQIQRADAARYMLLHHFGGVYSDLDIVCRRPFDEFLDNEVVLRNHAPGSVTNDLIMSAPGHPFFEYTISRLKRSFAFWQRVYIPRSFRIFLTAGPYFFTSAYRNFPRKRDIHILSDEVNSPRNIPAGRPDAHVRHIYGNSWASWDTHVIMFFYYRLRWLMVAVAFMMKMKEGLLDRAQDSQPSTAPVRNISKR